MAADASKSKRPGEFQLIETYFAPLATHKGAYGLVDDAALLGVRARRDLVLTVDTVVCGVHYLASDPPSAVAKKALRVNLSDLAAKGAEPVGYLLSLALCDDWTEEWLRGFALGLKDDQHRYGISLLGGDTTHTPGPTTVSITAFGTVPAGKMVPRQGARAGDAIFVTGAIGDAALGLLLHSERGFSAAGRIGEAARAHLTGRYLFPDPRLGFGQILRRYANAAMDISDGLAGDLAKMCRASGTDAAVEAALVPLSEPARALIEADPALLERALTGGDDYELLVAVPERRADRFAARMAEAGLPATRIGTMSRGHGQVTIRDSAGDAMSFAHVSYEHF